MVANSAVALYEASLTQAAQHGPEGVEGGVEVADEYDDVLLLQGRELFVIHNVWSYSLHAVPV